MEGFELSTLDKKRLENQFKSIFHHYFLKGSYEIVKVIDEETTLMKTIQNRYCT